MFHEILTHLLCILVGVGLGSLGTFLFYRENGERINAELDSAKAELTKLKLKV